jgi:hypothetical protein
VELDALFSVESEAEMMSWLSCFRTVAGPAEPALGPRTATESAGKTQRLGKFLTEKVSEAKARLDTPADDQAAQSAGASSSAVVPQQPCSVEEFVLERGGSHEGSLCMTKEGELGVAGTVDGQAVRSRLTSIPAHASPAAWGDIEACKFQLKGRCFLVLPQSAEPGPELEPGPEPEQESELSTGRSKLASMKAKAKAKVEEARAKVEAKVEEAKKSFQDNWQTGGKQVVLDASKHAVLTYDENDCAFSLTAGGSPIILVVANCRTQSAEWVCALTVAIECSRVSKGFEAASAKAAGPYQNPVDVQATLRDHRTTTIPRLDLCIRNPNRPTVSLVVEVRDSNLKQSDAFLAQHEGTKTALDGSIFAVLYVRDESGGGRIQTGVAHYQGWAPIFRTETVQRLGRRRDGELYTCTAVLFTIGVEHDEFRIAICSVEESIEGSGSVVLSLREIEARGGHMSKEVETEWRLWQSQQGPVDRETLQRNVSAEALVARGRVCHYVQIFIRTCSITAMIVCVFGRVQWRFVLNDSPARGQARERARARLRSAEQERAVRASADRGVKGV